ASTASTGKSNDGKSPENVLIRDDFTAPRLFSRGFPKLLASVSHASQMTQSERQQRSRIIVAFAMLYILWGSTYLAMRVIVRDMPPYVPGAVRYLIAAPIILAALALMGRKISLSLQDLRRLLVISILLLSIGNIGVLWGEEYVS